MQKTWSKEGEITMTRNAFGSLMLVLFTAIVTLTWVGDAAAVTSLSTCQTLKKASETYVLTADLRSSGDCLLLAADRVTIDLRGHSITGDGTGAGIHEGDSARTLITVRNGTIQGFQYGIDLASSTRSEIRNITSNANTTNGMILGNRALVKASTALRNAWYGIEALDYAQVQDSVASENGVGGILVGDHGVVTHNVADANVGDLPGDYVSGITAGAFATLNTNYVGNNSGHGISVGSGSQVNYNTADNNEGPGIQASCPSTVSNNKSFSNNPNYVMSPEGCRATNNK